MRKQLVITETKNTLVRNPETGSFDFCYIDGIDHPDASFPAGPVRMVLGEHKGPNEGNGVHHIWAEHEKNIRTRGFVSVDEPCFDQIKLAVAQFINEILSDGAFLYSEFNELKGTQKMQVVRSSLGTAILKFSGRPGQTGAHWRVHTAFITTRKTGTRIGKLESVEQENAQGDVEVTLRSISGGSSNPSA